MPSTVGLINQADARAQFEQFARFARTSGGLTGRTVAQVGGQLGPELNGAIASITAKSRFDFVGNIGRRQQSKAENNAVRDLFKEAVVKMCNSVDEQHLPENVKTAMKLEDYGKGRPLTARRILAVQTAVRQHDMEQTLIDAGVALDDTIKDRIKTAVSACGNDPGAFAVLKETWKAVLFETPDKEAGSMPNGAPLVPRGDKAVRNRAGNIASDVQSLRKITGGDEALFDAAKPFLALRDDQHPLSNSLLTRMVATVQQLQPGDLNPISALASPNPALSDIHAAALKLNELINGVMDGCGLARPSGFLMKNREDYREQLIASMILTKAVPNRSLNAVQGLLQSDEARKLRSTYIFSHTFPAHVFPGGEEADKKAIADMSLHAELALNTLKRAVDQRCDGVLSEEKLITAYDRADFDVYAPDSKNRKVLLDIQIQAMDYADA